MFLMDKEASNGPRARVEVLVGTPGSHIHTPVMEVKLNVTSCMGQVKTNVAALRKGREREGGRAGREEGRKGRKRKRGRERGEREGGRGKEGERKRCGHKKVIYHANNVHIILCSSLYYYNYI